MDTPESWDRSEASGADGAASPRDAADSAEADGDEGASEAEAKTSQTPGFTIDVNGNTAWSKGVPLDDRRAAMDYFTRGNEQARAGLRHTAIDAYRKALGLWGHPAFYYNLAMVQMELLQYREPIKNIEKALAYGPEPLGEHYFKVGQEMLEALKGMVGRVTITCNEPGAVVLLGKQPLFVGPGRYDDFVESGSYRLEARKDGMISAIKPAVVVSAGQSVEVDLVLKYEKRTRPMPGWVPWTVTTLGVAALAGAGWAHFEADRRFSEYDDKFKDFATRRADSAETDPRLENIREDAEDWRAKARVAYIAGGAALVTGVVLVLVNGERTEEVESRHGSGAASSLAVTPVITTDVVGVSAGIAF